MARVQTTRTVRFTIICLRAYLIIMLILLLVKFIKVID